MLKQILNLKGAQQLSKNEQNAIHGGGHAGCGPENVVCPTCTGLEECVASYDGYGHIVCYTCKPITGNT